MPTSYVQRVNPPGFEGCANTVTQVPQKEMQTTDVRVLVKPDQTSTTQATGKMDTAPGPGGL